ncbi:MAG: hypothetical protein ABJB22_07840, partial [Verrucomicrobiota bacterium]
MVNSTSLKADRELLLGGLLALILAFYFIEALTWRTAYPTSVTAGDQGAYLQYARQMHETHYAVTGGRNQMPVYPFLLSLLYRPGFTESEFLARAQVFNVCLSAVILLLLLILYRRHFPAYYGAALVVATAFAVFLIRAPCARAELLFYFLSFCLFLSFWKMLVAPDIPLAVWTGALAGLAHLTKASVLPALLIFTGAFALKVIREYRLSRVPAVGRGAVLLALVLATFLAIVFPYLQTSKRVFGHYFYNVNSTFYMWCDSWPEAKALTGAHGDRIGWPTLPPDQIPSEGKYWRDHSFLQIAGRLSHGVLKLVTHNARVDGYYKYIALLTGTAAVLAIRKRVRFGELLRSRIPLAVFLGLFFVGYFMLYAWYVPILVDSRFVLALFLPLTFTASKLIDRLVGDGTIKLAGRRVAALPLFAAVFLVFATVDVLYTEVWLSGRSAAHSERQ